MADNKSKNPALISVLWCDSCNVRPTYLIKGYKCPECGNETIKKEVPKEIAYTKKQIEPENDALSWLDG